MNRTKILATVAVAAVLSFPAATATWYVHGTYEPDTLRDEKDGYMFATPDTNPTGLKVYFNAVQNTHQTGVNPNVGTLGTSIRATPAQTMAAYLGVWKDCNGDGFIGAADGAITEYQSVLATGTACPDAGACPTTGAPAFNCGGWVYEFLWIGPGDNTGNEQAFATRRLINDTTSLVWGDWGLPDGQRPGGSCGINPQPAGTFGSTGGLIGYVDCSLGRRIMGAGDLVEQNTGLQTGFDDKSRPQHSDSLLNQRIPAHPWYDPYHEDSTGAIEYESGDAAFTTSDCSSTDEVALPGGQLVVADPTGQLGPVTDEEGNLLYVGDEDGALYSYGAPTPGVRGYDAEESSAGSFWDGANDTAEAFLDGCEEDSGRNVPTATVEAAYGGSNTIEKGRMITDHYFSFNGVALNPSAFNGFNSCVFQDDPDFGDVPEGCEEVYLVPPNAVPRDTPQDLGAGAYRQALGLGSGWTSQANWLREPQLVNRADGTATSRTYATFYASVGSATLTLGASVPASGTSIYGAEWCQGATTGVVNGWDCDASHWWNPKYDSANTNMPWDAVSADEQCTTPRGTETSPPPAQGCRETGAKTGRPYRLRDIDCWDGQVAAGVEVYASLVAISERGPCDRPT